MKFCNLCSDLVLSMAGSLRFSEPAAGFALLDGITDYAIFLLNAEGELVHANRGASRYEAPILEPDMFEGARNQGSASRETTVRRTHGEVVEALLSLYPAPVGFVLILREIRAEKQLERQLRMNNAKLIAETQRAENASQAKSHFIATVSHEIRTPLNAILGMADMLGDSHLDSSQRHYVSVFQRAGHRLLNLINNLLDLTKIESGRMELEQIEFHLDEVVHRSVELIAPKAQDKGLTVEVRIAPEIPLARIGDPTRLQQIFLNLLSNSVKFTKFGTVSVCIEAAEGNSLAITVADTGMGIPREKLATVFRDFTQVDTSTTREYGGTGLGLGIVRRLVELMGGRIGVESTPGVGTKFHILLHLPLAAVVPVRPAAAMVVPREENLQNEPKRHLLIAEDSADNQILMRAYFERSPYVLTFVEDGRQAVEQFAAGKYDLILMDVQMPGMDGWSATRAIRDMERKRGSAVTPIIALTAGARAADEESSRRAGCQDHLTKPIARQTLFEAIERCCQRVEPAQPPAAVRALAPAYLNKRRQEVPLLLELLGQSDYARIATLAHNLKGTGRLTDFRESL